MATIRLVPSTIYNAASSYLTITSQDNAFTNTDSTTYATIQNTNASTNNRYIYLRGFNFDDIPNNAIINSWTVKIKGYYSNGYQSTLYLCNNTTTQRGATATGFANSSATRTFNNGSLTWETISNWGDNFSIRVNCRRNSRNTAATYYIYGAEILVDYTVPTPRTITSSISGTGTINPSGSVTLYDGDNYILTISNVTNPIVTDNNIDVTSQLESVTSGTKTFIPYNYENSGFTISNIENAYTNINDSTYANCDAPAGGATSHLYLNLGPITIPSSATISSVSCQASLQISRNNSSSGMNVSCQMYSGNTAKGSATSLATTATDVARNTYTLNVGTWTATELQDARFHIAFTNSASSTHRYIYVYGVDLTVIYTINGITYIYTISNVTADHTIVVSSGGGGSTTKIYLKENNTWTQYSKVYKK